MNNIQMQYTVTLDDESSTYTIKVTGTYTRPDDTFKIQQLAKTLSQENAITRFVVDMREAEITSSPADEYEAAIMPLGKDHALNKVRFASVYSGNLNDHKFMETVAVNRGYQVRIFNDIDQAKDWVCRK